MQTGQPMDRPVLAAVRLFLTWIVSVVSPGGTVRIGPGVVASVPAFQSAFSRAKPHMVTAVLSGMVMVNTSARR